MCQNPKNKNWLYYRFFFLLPELYGRGLHNNIQDLSTHKHILEISKNPWQNGQ